jgi:hypothetical protein
MFSHEDTRRNTKKKKVEVQVIWEQAEQLFVETFIQKNRRARAIFELNSKKRRGDFFHKLCHQYFGVLDQRFMERISSSNVEYILKKSNYLPDPIISTNCQSHPGSL